VSSAQAKLLAAQYVPWDRELGRRAFARRFGVSISQIDYWLAKMGGLSPSEWRSRGSLSPPEHVRLAVAKDGPDKREGF
jgi:hypothetical protein